MNKKWTDEYIRNDLLQKSDTLDEELWKEFTDFFRNEKGYEDWTDDEINLSLNDDDITEFIQYLKEREVENNG